MKSKKKTVRELEHKENIQDRKSLPMERLQRVLLFGVAGIFLLSSFLAYYVAIGGNPFSDPKVPMEVYHNVYDISILGNSPEDRKIKYGYELFMDTPKYLGPESGTPYAGNNLSCNNCHLSSGTKPYAAPLIGILQRYPQFRKRENRMGSIEDRIQGCMLRSMNGTELPREGREMKAFIAYLEWLGRYAPADGKIQGRGLMAIEVPKRPVDLDAGKRIFAKHCVVCHGGDGQGKKAAQGHGYVYPPLWGPDSYNNGAGMTRVITAARFIKANMPFGTRYDQPALTDVEAYDVAGFINQRHRPQKQGLEADYPDLKLKPVSSPYGPYRDPFPLEQHQLGPFQPIMEYYKVQYNLIKNQ